MQVAEKFFWCYIIGKAKIIFQEEILMGKDNRFIKVYKQDMGSTEIWVDKETGVNYLYHQSGYSGGLTVLLDKDGKPIVTHVEE